jgi:hypothetical protein
MEIVKPTGEAIGRFSHETDAVFQQINTHKRKIGNLQRTRDLLPPRLISGQVSCNG